MFVAPITPSRITSGWDAPREYRDGRHYGADFEAILGQPVKAIGDGKVAWVDAKDDSNAGLWVAILHNNGYVSRYLHLDTIAVAKGEHVLAGQVIGTAGNTGTSKAGTWYGAHLHLDIFVKAAAFLTHVSKYGIPKSGWLHKDPAWGQAVPVESLVPAEWHSDKVLASAKANEIPVYVKRPAPATGWFIATATAMGAGIWWLAKIVRE